MLYQSDREERYGQHGTLWIMLLQSLELKKGLRLKKKRQTRVLNYQKALRHYNHCVYIYEEQQEDAAAHPDK
jgi:hypothetical protein